MTGSAAALVVPSRTSQSALYWKYDERRVRNRWLVDGWSLDGQPVLVLRLWRDARPESVEGRIVPHIGSCQAGRDTSGYPASDYFDGSATRPGPTDYEPARDASPFTTHRSTGAVPRFAPAASSRVRRSSSSWPLTGVSPVRLPSA